MKYAHTNIITSNWKRLAEFYIQVFDCQVVPPERNQSGKWLERGTRVPNAKLQGVHLRLPGYGETGPTLEIYEYGIVKKNLPTIANRQGFGHIAFEVGNVIETLQNLVRYGGTQWGEVISKEIPGRGLLEFTYAKDPDGNLIEIQNWK